MKHVSDMIPAFVSGDLAVDRMAAIEEHLQACPACRKEVDRAREVWDLLAVVDTVPRDKRSAWPAIRARTLGRTREREWFFGSGRLTRAGLATAALAAGLVLGILLPSGASRNGAADMVAAGTGANESSWLYESSWLSDSSWRASDGTAGLDDVLLGADLLDEGGGS